MHTTQMTLDFFAKFALCFLSMGLAFYLFSGSFVQLPWRTIEPSLDVGETLPSPAAESPVVIDSLLNGTQISENEECNIFIGQWVPDPSGPIYTNETCHTIQAHQNCMKNGRPDSEYLYWRWKPRDCELPRFDPRRLLDLMRDKSWAFIGDSISRNHLQSFLCILSQVEQGVDQVYHDKEYGTTTWNFPSQNFTVSAIWAPFLVKADVLKDINGSDDVRLHLDKLDVYWTEQYDNFDYVIIAGGKWFPRPAIYYENDTIQGCHYCPGKNWTELGFEYAYRKVLQLVLNHITSSSHKAYVFLRTTAPDHFENGAWFSGGYCNRTSPFKQGDVVDFNSMEKVMRNIELEEFDKAVAALGSRKGIMTTLKLLDTARLSLLRPDGHPGVYTHPFAADKNNAKLVQNDCLHWCLPGPIDSWNELVMKMLSSGS